MAKDDDEGSKFRHRVYSDAIDCVLISRFWPAPLRDVIGAKIETSITWRQVPGWLAHQSVVGAPLVHGGHAYTVVVITPKGTEHGLIVDWLFVHELAHLVYKDYKFDKIRYGPCSAEPEYRANLFALAVLVVKDQVSHHDLWLVVEKFRSLGHQIFQDWAETDFLTEVARILRLQIDQTQVSNRKISKENA